MVDVCLVLCVFLVSLTFVVIGGIEASSYRWIIEVRVYEKDISAK